MKITNFTKLSQIFSPKVLDHSFYGPPSPTVEKNMYKNGTTCFSKMLWSLCYSYIQVATIQKLWSQKNNYLFYLIWWQLLHILQFVNTLAMAVIVTEEITSALFQQVDDNAQARQVPIRDHWCLCI